MNSENVLDDFAQLILGQSLSVLQVRTICDNLCLLGEFMSALCCLGQHPGCIGQCLQTGHVLRHSVQAADDHCPDL